jgi:hypothetical protein
VSAQTVTNFDLRSDFLLPLSHKSNGANDNGGLLKSQPRGYKYSLWLYLSCPIFGWSSQNKCQGRDSLSKTHVIRKNTTFVGAFLHRLQPRQSQLLMFVLNIV